MACPVVAQEPTVATAFEHFYNLEFDAALDGFTKLAERAPNDAQLQNHLGQTLLFREMLRAGALETELVTGGSAFLRLPKMNPSAADQRRFYAAIDANEKG